LKTESIKKLLYLLNPVFIALKVIKESLTSKVALIINNH